MARIRSVHPSLYTDEDFMALSMAARVLLPGLWTEADDHGVFAWKPLTIKARILPADAVDIGSLLAELEAMKFLKRFESEGKEYGIIRNFLKYQRPKKPSYIHTFPPEFSTYVGSKPVSSPPVENHSPTAGVKSQQMEDGGGRREEGERGNRESSPPSEPSATQKPTQALADELPELPAFLDRRKLKGAVALPDWLPKPEWAGFVEMRKRIKAPLTDRAITLAIGELEKLRAQGEDIAAVIDQSTLKGWKSFFPRTNGSPGKHYEPEPYRILRLTEAETSDVKH